MTLAELKELIAGILHRTDLSGQMDSFVLAAHTRINTRFSVSLVYPMEDEEMPANFMLYLYAALQSANEYLNNGDSAGYYGAAFVAECDQQGISLSGTPLDYYEGAPPTIERLS